MSAAPGDGRSWRERLMPWLMALVRLTAGWLVVAQPLARLLAGHGDRLLAGAGAGPVAVAAVLGVGLAAFAWPRSCLGGLALLLAGLAAGEWHWRSLGLPPTPRLLSSVAILAVLGAGEWLTRRVAGRR